MHIVSLISLSILTKKSPYTDSNGNVFESYEAYCNSPDLDEYTVMLKLHSGSRKPQNEKEHELLEEMKKIESNGGVIDFTEGTY